MFPSYHLRNITMFLFYSLVELQGVDVGKPHRSKNYGWEFIFAIDDVIVNKQLARIKQAPFYCIIADESTDISVTKNLAVYIKYRDGVSISMSIIVIDACLLEVYEPINLPVNWTMY